MILTCNVGNTNIKLGLFAGETLVRDWRLTTDSARTADERGLLWRRLFLDAGLATTTVKAAVICSVVPPLQSSLEETCRRYFGLEPLFVGPGVKTGLSIRVDNPGEVGTDRIVNAVAGFELYGGPLVIVDLGTATTFGAVSQRGEFLGGAIAPGIGIAAEALFRWASKLPRVEICRPPAVIGKNTVHSMQAGILYGAVGLVEGILARMKEELGPARVIATGGFAGMIAAETAAIDRVEPFLTLTGLRIIYERNRGVRRQTCG
ncbi:MAG: type III pantothenate kinase [Peptococcaceae bacterium]|jgi:type III pantothenate kinase|nr:type III pantothenate kinase [Peptococcaceae bacterium]